MRDVGLSNGQIPLLDDFPYTNSWCKLPNGLILQWGSAVCAAQATTVTSFPIPFPNSCRGVSAWGYQVSGGIQAYTVFNGFPNPKMSFQWNAFYAGSGNVPSLALAASVNIHFLAIGN